MDVSSSHKVTKEQSLYHGLACNSGDDDVVINTKVKDIVADIKSEVDAEIETKEDDTKNKLG